MNNHGFNKESLSLELIEKQKSKGTYDSPCMSVCNYDDTGQCQTCLMFQVEKQKWKVSSDSDKAAMAKTFMERINLRKT